MYASFKFLKQEHLDNYAYILYLQNKFEQTKQTLLQQVQKTPLNEMIAFKLEGNKNLNDLENTYNNNPQDPLIPLELGIYYFLKQDLDTSLKFFQLLSKKDIYAKGMEIRINILKGDTSKNLIQELLDISKDDTNSLCFLGQYKLKKNENDYRVYLEKAASEFNYQAMIILAFSKSDMSLSEIKKLCFQSIQYGLKQEEAKDFFNTITNKKHQELTIDIMKYFDNIKPQTTIPAGEARKDLVKKSLKTILTNYQGEINQFSEVLNDINPLNFIFPLSVLELKEFGMSCSLGETETLESLLSSGKFSFDVFDKTFENTGLHIASFYDKPEIILSLIKRPKCDINQKNIFEWTPLHIAVMCGNVNTTKVLVNLNCDVDCKDKYGRTPFHLAIILNQTACVEILTNSFISNSRNTINIDQPDYSGLTPLHYATILSRFEFMKILMNLNADLNIPCFEKNNTPLHYSVYSQSIIPTKYLVLGGAKFLKNSKDKEPFEQEKINSFCKNWLQNLVKDESKYHFKNLVFQGNGVKGVCFIGALNNAVKKKVLNLSHIVRVGGTSGSSLITLLLGVGYSLDEIDNIISSLDFKIFLIKGIDINSYLKDDYDSLLFSALKDLINTKSSKKLIDYSKSKLIFSGELFEEWVDQIIKNKTGTRKTTFKEAKLRDKFKEMFFVGTNITTGENVVFSHETTPDMIISEAVRMSMSIPGIFEPKNSIIDGASTNIFPMFLFDNYKYFGEGEGKAYNPETLGFKIIPDTNFHDEFELVQKYIETNEIFNHLNVVFDVLNYTYSKQIQTYKSIDNNRICFIRSNNNISTIGFNISSDYNTQKVIRISSEASIDDFINRTQSIQKNLDSDLTLIIAHHMKSYKLIKKLKNIEISDINLEKSPQLIYDIFKHLLKKKQVEKFQEILKDLVLDIEMIDSETKDSVLSIFLKESSSLTDLLSLLENIPKNSIIYTITNLEKKSPIDLAKNNLFVELLKSKGAK